MKLVIVLYLVLKLDKANEVLDAENAHQQVEPKFLTFALLVALAGPFLDKLVGRCPLFGCLHRHLQFNFFQIYNLEMAEIVKSMDSKKRRI